MSNLTVSSDAVAALLRRLEAGESLDQVLQPQVPADEAAVLMRAAVPRTFDPALFTSVLTTPDSPSLQTLAERGRIEPVAGAMDRYRVRPDLVADLFGRWWPDGKVPTRPTPPPRDLKRLLTRLVTFHTKRHEDLEALYHVVLLDQARAMKRFDELFARADVGFDLAGCQDVIAAVGLQARNTLIGPGLRKRVNDRVRYLRVRGDHAADYYRTARFFEPAGFRAQIDSFLTGRSTRVVQVVAEGGMGKTMRLRWFVARKCIPEQIPVARIDFDDVDPIVAGTDPWLVLLEIALQLHDQLPGTPFDKLRSDFGEYRPLLRRGTRQDGGPGANVDLVDVRKRAEVEVPDRVRAGLAESVGKRTAVLILDTTEELVVPVERNVSGLWDQLNVLLGERSGMRLILAGRYDLAVRSDAFAEAFPKARVRQLEPFSARQSAAYLRSRGITDAALIRAIVAKSGGRPFKLALFGDIVHLGAELTASDVAAYREPDLLFLVARVLDRITDPGVRWLLRYGVIPRRLTLGLAMGPLAPFLARGMAGDPTFDDPSSDGTPPARRIDGPAFPTGIVEPGAKPPVEQLWRTLREYAASASWVSMEDADTLRFQPEVIEPMRLVLRGKPAWSILQDAAATWFERRATEDPEHWGGWIAEAAYHRFQRDGEEAVRWWRSQLDHAQALARTDWLRRIAEEAPRTAEPAPDVPPAATAGTPSERAPESTVIAEFELAGLEAAEARRRMASRSDSIWQTAGKRLARAVALDAGRDLIPAIRLASVRAALAYGRGEPDVARYEIARARSLNPAERDEAALATLQAEILADTGEPGLEDAIGVALSAITALARINARTMNGTIELGVGVLAAAALRNDRIVEAIRVYEYTLKNLRPDPARRTDIQLMLADLEIRSGQPGLALDRLQSVGLAEADRGQWFRREVIRARAELAARRPREAIQIATDVIEGLNQDVLGPDAPSDPLELEATAREVRGDALIAVMLHSAALDDLDRARNTWSVRHDPEGVCRTLVTAITLQLRGRGDLKQAQQLLVGLESADPPVGGDAWTDGQLRRAEWYSRTGNPDRAREIIDETQRSLAGLTGSPARRIRAALAGLALGGGADREGDARSLAAALGAVEAGSVRLALLRDLELIPALGAGLPESDLVGLSRLASAAEPLASPIDDALAQIRLVEVDRVAGQRDQALARLRRLTPRLERLQLWTALTDSVDAALRLDDPELALAIGDVAERGDPSAAGGWPTDRAARLTRLASAALSGRRFDEAHAMLDEAERLVEDPRSATAARILVVQAIVAEMTGREADAVTARRSAAETYRALGDLVAAEAAAAPPANMGDAPTSSGDETTFVDEPDPVIRVRVDVRGRDLEVRVYAPIVGPAAPEPGPRARFPDAVGAVGHLDNPDAPPERALKEAMERLGADWHAYGRDLGSYLSPAGVDRALQVSVGPVGVTIEAMNHLLPPIPWELASIGGRGAIVLDPQVAWFARIQPAGTIDEDVRYAQATLARVSGVRIFADGIPGPATADAVRRFQLDAGLPEHGLVDAETLGALRRRALDADGFPPRVVLVRTAFDRQMASQSVGYDADFGVDLYRLYDAAGYRVELLDTPSIEGLAAFTSDPSTAIVHLAAGIRLTSGGIVSLDFAEAGFSRISREGPELTASVVGRVLERGGEGPLVVVDVPRPSSPSEAARQLMLRNRFAADLFESGSASAVVATGLMQFTTNDSHGILFDGLRRGESVAEACAAARRVSAPGVDQLEGLPDAAAVAAIALFARTPESGIGLGRVAR